jgi:hypothetical protein
MLLYQLSCSSNDIRSQLGEIAQAGAELCPPGTLEH